MRMVALFIAMSLDGYIADDSGKVDWLKGQNQQEENIDTYAAFIKDIDTVVMGWNTYHQIVTELSPEEWVYADLTSYVITHREVPSTTKIIFTEKNPCEMINELKRKPGKDIWICGGASIVRQLIAEDLIDKYYISVIPVILGSGIRLFMKRSSEIKLKLVHTQTYNGITDLVYMRR
ncbi:dihydrofolate reductase family protein [Lachnospiraceae bacterium 62-35]